MRKPTAMIKPIVMPFSDLLKLLRIPFSFFLLPVFLFAFSDIQNPSWFNFAALFIILHFLIYPASNAYNSYMDQDTESIGGLEHPPLAGKELFHASIILDVAGFTAGFLISPVLALLLTVYILASRLYSWRTTRLKKYPWYSWIIVSLIQGGFTYMISSMSFMEQFELSWFNTSHLYGFIASTLMVGGFYPLTQIYQHEQDLRSGDITISYVMGVRGTFIFSGGLFASAFAIIFHYYESMEKSTANLLFFSFLILPVCYFFKWFFETMKDPSEASFRNSLRMNIISSSALIAAFLSIAYHGQQ